MGLTLVIVVVLFVGASLSSGAPRHARAAVTQRAPNRISLSRRTAVAAAHLNPIQLENRKRGTTAWELPGGSAQAIGYPSSHVHGYGSTLSVLPGQTLKLHISTKPAASYRIEVFRLGWYQGLGGRLYACLPSCSKSKRGRDLPVPAPDPTTGLLDAHWPVTDTVKVGRRWVSGYFIAKLLITGGPDRGQAAWVPFIVRSQPSRHSAIVVQAAVNTWEAYSGWGGKSLYPVTSVGGVVPASQTIAAAMVSFNRPLSADQPGPFGWEYQFVRFVERHGYDVSYQTDIDTDLHPGSLLGHHLDIASGHDEYWSPTIRNAWEAARNAGVNLAFIGADLGVWQSRYANNDQTLVEYRSATLDPEPNPILKTVHFASPPVNRPECTLLGVGYPGGATDPTDPPRSYSVTQAAMSNPWFHGTGLKAGDTLFDTVGYEWDSVQSSCSVPPLQVLLHFAGLHGVLGSPNSADAVTYTAPSGARVFSDGSLQVAWALDDFGHPHHADPRVQRLFVNIFNDLER